MAFFILCSLCILLNFIPIQGSKVGYFYDNQNPLKCRAVSLVGPTQTNGMCALTCNEKTDPAPCMGFAVTNQGCQHCMKCPVSLPWQNLTTGQLYEAIPVDYLKDLQEGKGFTFLLFLLLECKGLVFSSMLT